MLKSPTLSYHFSPLLPVKPGEQAKMLKLCMRNRESTVISNQRIIHANKKKSERELDYLELKYTHNMIKHHL